MLCLSSDSMRNHPEIPHKPHLLDIWPATMPCSPVQPPETFGLCSDTLLQRKRSQHEGETQDMRDWTKAVVFGKDVLQWQHRGSYHLLMWGEFVLWLHCSSMNVGFGYSYQMMTISHCLLIMWLTRWCGDLTSTYIPSLHPPCHQSYVSVSSNNL